MREDEAGVLAAPVYATRRERRAAERLAEQLAAPQSSPAEPAPAEPAPVGPVAAEVVAAEAIDRPAPEVVAPVVTVVPPAEHVARRRRPAKAQKPSAAKLRESRGRRVGRGVLSAGAALVAAALAVGMTLPANVFGQAAPVAASELPEGMTGEVEEKQGLAVAAAVLEAQAPAERDGYGGESFAAAERARYQASGQGFAPGFVPTAGAIRWPFDYSVPITSGFGYSEGYGGYHSGIDFIPGEGAPVGAIADGVVTWVGWDNSGYGYHVRIQSAVDGHKIVAIYAHLIDQSAQMYPGQVIKAGDFVGLTGATGYSFGAHLHLGIEQDGSFVDPFQWLTEHATNEP